MADGCAPEGRGNGVVEMFESAHYYPVPSAPCCGGRQLARFGAGLPTYPEPSAVLRSMRQLVCGNVRDIARGEGRDMEAGV